MARTTTALSVRADRQYAKRLFAIVKEKDHAVADVVRKALDIAYGADLSGLEASLITSSGTQSNISAESVPPVAVRGNQL